jgi:hypothetical protein
MEPHENSETMETIGLELTLDERELILKYVNTDVEILDRIRETPASEPVVSLSIDQWTTLRETVFDDLDGNREEEVETKLDALWRKLYDFKEDLVERGVIPDDDDEYDEYDEENDVSWERRTHELLALFADAVLGPANQPSTEDHEQVDTTTPAPLFELNLAKGARALLHDLPGLSDSLVERLGIKAKGSKLFQFSLEEVASIARAVSVRMEKVPRGNDQVLDRLSEKILDLMRDCLSSSAFDDPIRVYLARATGVPLGLDVIFQLRITLVGSNPPIWRRVAVPNITLAQLHNVIQNVMDWNDDHLHSFTIGRQTYAGGNRFRSNSAYSDTTDVQISDVIVRENARFLYTYDFGDTWEHEIAVESIYSPEKGRYYPICLAGARACPPEDCGGVLAYARILGELERRKADNSASNMKDAKTAQDISEPIAKSKEEDDEELEYDEFAERYGDLDPEKFDLDRINGRFNRWTLL